MQRFRPLIMFLAAGVLFAVISGIVLVTTQPAQAQCGSQASSCKNCHEVQAKDPVNNDGNPWHTSHAFGDFCYICHGGNSQSTDETQAHTGMVSPLSDVQAACQQCHPNDLQERAQVYASALGVEVGTGGGEAQPPAGSDSGTGETSPGTSSGDSSSSQGQPSLLAPASIDPNDPNLVDYVKNYNEAVLGQHTTNWGNLILMVMIGAMLVGGGGLVLHNEHLVRISFRETKPVQAEYPADVVEMLPDISRLKPNARKSLRRLLEKPEATADVLTSLDKLAGNQSSSNEEQEN